MPLHTLLIIFVFVLFTLFEDHLPPVHLCHATTTTTTAASMVCVGDLKTLFGALRHSEVQVDSFIFKLFSTFTALIMLVALVIATTGLFNDEHLYCDSARIGKKIDTALVSAHCHMHGTYRNVPWFYVHNDDEAIGYRMRPQSDHGHGGFFELYPGISVLPEFGNSSHPLNEKIPIVYTYFNWLFMIFFLIVSPGVF